MLAKTHAPDTEPGDGLDEPFMAAFRSMRMPAMLADARQAGHPIVFVNEAFTRLTGYASHETLGRDCRFLEGAETDPGTADAIGAALRSGVGIETDILHYRKDGSPFWSALSVDAVHDESGDLRHFVLLLCDSGISKETWRRHEALNLEDGVGRRTLDLQAALDQKTALLHEVEHRVKNSLQMVSSLVLLKARRTQSPEARRVLQDIAERVGALSTVHRLLYAAADASVFDLEAFVTELAGELFLALPSKQIALRLDLEPVGVPVAKAASLALLLNELVGNALKHAFPDGRRGELRIEVRRVEKGLMIAVADDGIGRHPSLPPEGSFGKTLIAMLVQQLKGQLTWLDMTPGTRAQIVMPMNAREMQLEPR